MRGPPVLEDPLFNNIFLFLGEVPCPAKNQIMVGNDIGVPIENVHSWDLCGEYLCTIDIREKIIRRGLKARFLL